MCAEIFKRKQERAKGLVPGNNHFKQSLTIVLYFPNYPVIVFHYRDKRNKLAYFACDIEIHNYLPMTSQFEIAVADSLRNATPITGNNMRGFEDDLLHVLSGSPYFSRVTTKHTGDQRTMFIATCTRKQPYQEPTSVEQELRALWQTQIAYHLFEAYEIQRDDRQVVLRFVTLSGQAQDDLCVTGSIQVML